MIATFTGLPSLPALPRKAGRIAAFAVAGLMLLTTAPAQAQSKDKDPLLAKVNGAEIHQSDLAAAETDAGQIPPMSEDAKKDYLVQFLSDMMLVTKAAEDKKLADSPEFKLKLELARKKLLMENLLSSVAKDAMTDAAMQKVYDDAVTKMSEQKEVHARHILFRAAADDEKANKAAEDKAKAVIVRLNKGEAFEKVANELTEDPSGKANGGDLGYFAKEQMVPEFADVAFGLEKGKISAPVKTQFGWHVIKVEDQRIKPKPTFEEVKPQIQQYVVRKAQADMITKLRAEAKIEKFYTVEAPKKDDDKKDTPAEPEKK